MAITDNKTFGWNINLKQFGGLVLIGAVVVLAIWSDSLVIGYTLMTLVLCAFFMVVAFDIGLGRTGKTPATEAPDAAPEPRAARGRTAREI
jgi:hypothetical protein